jgi:hypothetical protein
LSDGAFLNSQPENTLCHASGASLLARSSTNSWTKAPSSCGFSHGRVFSQVASLITTLPIRRASPDFSKISCERLLRLLRSPSVATRSPIGVP